MKNSKFPHLLSQGRIGNVTLPNRVIMGPTETLYASAMGEVTQPIIKYYEARAKGGAGMIVLHSIQGNTRIDPVDPYAGSLRLDNDAYIPMMRELTERVHRYGTKIAALVSIGGGARANGDRYLDNPGEEVLVGPVAMEAGTKRRPVRQLTVEEIHQTVEAYGKCALRAKMAGFDAFYIHALGAYLLAEFLSPLFNTRKDGYGGSFENRFRLLFELLEACHRYAGKDFPCIVRFSVDELCEGGRTLEESVLLAQKLEEAGVAALDISVGFGERKSIRMPSIYVQPRTMESSIQRIKSSVHIPVIYQGRLNVPLVAEQVLEDGLADFVLISRGFIAEPEWGNKVAQGRMEEMRNCLCCNYCLAGRIVNKLPLRCAFNPLAGRESWRVEKVPSGQEKHIVVIGAGPAGLEAARVLGERGHRVDLYEASDCICGGQLLAAQQPPAKQILKNIPQYYETVLKKQSRIQLHLSTQVSGEMLFQWQADAYVIATGAVCWEPSIPGMELANRASAVDVLLGKAETGDRVLIAGGGQVGAETAHFLARQGKEVCVVEMQDRICAQEEPNTREALLTELEELGVQLRTNCRIVSMEQGRVQVQKHDGALEAIACDSIVTAFGMKPERKLYEALEKSEKPVYLIGDANRVSNIAHAIEEGFLLGCRL